VPPPGAPITSTTSATLLFCGGVAACAGLLTGYFWEHFSVGGLRERGQPVHGFAVLPRLHVAVQVHRWLERGVAELFLDVEHGLACLQLEARVGVAQVMDPYLSRPRAAKHPVPAG